MKRRYSIILLLVVAVLSMGWTQGPDAQQKPTGALVVAWHVTLAPAWFDPGVTPSGIVPFGILYALHDRLIMKGVPEGTTRLAMLKKGEADITFSMQGAVALEVKRDPNLTLVDTRYPSIFWIEFADQWDTKSVWADTRVRLAVNYALDRQAINEAVCLGYCPPAGVIVPRLMDYALPAEPFPYNPEKAKQLLAEAGYPNGLDAGELTPMSPFFDVAEAAVNYLNAVGIRVKMRTMERAPFLTAWREKKLRNLILTASGISGNAATRVEGYIYSKGSYAYGGYPDIDALFEQQAVERDRAKREALLHRIQQLTVERAMFTPIMDLRGLTGVGPRVADHTINSIPLYPFPSWEDVRLNGGHAAREEVPHEFTAVYVGAVRRRQSPQPQGEGCPRRGRGGPAASGAVAAQSDAAEGSRGRSAPLRPPLHPS